jgi:translation initiation factor 2B subunit (eIF-2B alpha/beta/delta family)
VPSSFLNQSRPDNDVLCVHFPREPGSQAKDSLCQKIDNYIRDKIIMADQVIQEVAGKKIKEGDVLMTFGRYEFSFREVKHFA